MQDFIAAKGKIEIHNIGIKGTKTHGEVKKIMEETKKSNTNDSN